MGAHRRPSTTVRVARNTVVTTAATGGLLTLTPGTASASTIADFERLAECESGGRWDYNGSSGFDGGVQFLPSTWTSITRGENLPEFAWQASKGDQIRMADKLLQAVARETGSVERAWATQFPACSAKMGLRGVQPGLQLPPSPAPPVIEPPTDPVPAQPIPTPGNEAPTEPIPAQQTLTIVVEDGDWLSTIARDKTDLCPPEADIRECWKPLYEQNRGVIGSDPYKIYPGQVLTWHGLALPGGPPVEVSDEIPPAVVDEPVEPQPGEPRRDEEEARAEFAYPGGVLPGRTNFGAPRSGGSRAHQGLDTDCAKGDPLFAATDGLVTVSGSVGGYGNAVYLVSPDGTETRYGHLDSRAVAKGDVVVAGDVIGTCGNTGNVVAGPNGDGSHLHFEVRPGGGAAIDPLPWLRDRGLV